MKKNNKKYLLQLNESEHLYIKSKAKEMGLSIKELIIISIYGLTNGEQEKAS
jgi:hypothetical protein